MFDTTYVHRVGMEFCKMYAVGSDVNIIMTKMCIFFNTSMWTDCVVLHSYRKGLQEKRSRSKECMSEHAMDICDIKHGAKIWWLYTACDVNKSHKIPSLHSYSKIALLLVFKPSLAVVHCCIRYCPLPRCLELYSVLFSPLSQNGCHHSDDGLGH